MIVLRAAVLVVLALAAAACTSEVGSGTGDDGAARKTVRPVYGDTLIEALLGDIQGLIPNITSDSASHTIGNLIYSGLVKRDESLRLVGDLAESWTVSRDCRNMTFQLKKNAKWHDGRPFTADDVVFTYQAMVNPKTPTAYKEDFKAVESIEAVDAHTVRVRYARPYAKALQSWSTTMLPRHLLESYVTEGRLREAPQNRESPVGTGPYRFKEWRTGEKVVLTANRDYYDTGPYLSRLVYRIIPSQATIFLELKAKGIDSSSTLTAGNWATIWRVANSAAAPSASSTDKPVSRFGVTALKRAAIADSGTAQGSITKTVQQASRSFTRTAPEGASVRPKRRRPRAMSLLVAVLMAHA